MNGTNPGFVPVNVAAVFGDDPGPVTPADLPIKWRVVFEERAAVFEYDGGLDRVEAEMTALAYVARGMTDNEGPAP